VTNHAVVACGWDNNACGGQGAWLMKNSWGTYWGEGGYCWVQFGSSTFGANGRLLDIWLPPEALVAYRSHQVLDGSNGKLDPGQTAQIAITVTNYGLDYATGVSGTLHALTPGITVIDAQADFPDMASWDSGTSQGDHFTVRAESGVAIGTLIQFELEIECDQATDTSEFYDFVGPITVIYANDFEGSVTGWTHSAVSGTDDWVLGLPRVLLGHWDPQEAASGTHLYGNDLNWVGTSWDGLYPSASRNYLQSPAVNCDGQTGVHLLFNRWLASEHSGWDVASIMVQGTEVWRNEPTYHHKDYTWVPVALDISALADNQPSVRVRFDMDCDEAWEFGGWNIDDFQIVATNADAADISGQLPAAPLSLMVRPSPNPFVNVTGLKLMIPTEVAEADLQIFDPSGRMVRTIHRGSIEPGMHHFTWTGNDEMGQPVPAGTYYCRAQSGEHSVVTKVLRID
jgi:hypothetical protein